jgi:bifunctional non-homologous end joining protein LigD
MNSVAVKPRSAGNSRSAPSQLKVDGKKLSLSNLDKVLYPKTGFTKGEVIDYYIRVAPVLLPHLRDRPLTLKRYPNGVDAPFFYEKRCPSHRPDWVETTAVWSERSQSDIHFCVVNDLATLIWAANLADLELHPYLARAGQVDCPTYVVFDLDPGPPAAILESAQAALWLKELLDRLQLKSFPKTSGSKGLQVYVPLNTPVTYEVTKNFAKALAELLQQQNPKNIVSRMEKSLRRNKVFIDWSQNDQHKTTVCVYSLRAKETPSVSTPLKWEEVERAAKRNHPGGLAFSPSQALSRIKRHGDLFAPVLELQQKLPTV